MIPVISIVAQLDGLDDACRAAKLSEWHQMRNLLDELSWFESDPVGSRPSPSGELIDVEDGDVVLHFTYRYLEAHSLPPSDDEVHNVTATIARYKGPRVVQWAALESFLAGPFTMQRD